MLPLPPVVGEDETRVREQYILERERQKQEELRRKTEEKLKRDAERHVKSKEKQAHYRKLRQSSGMSKLTSRELCPA